MEVHRQGCWQPEARAEPRACPRAAAAVAQGFHASRMAASEAPARALEDLRVAVRPAQTDEELHASAVLRARSFYVYPPERAFAGQLHQRVKIEEEYELLRRTRDAEAAAAAAPAAPSGREERKECLIAVSRPLAGPEGEEQILLGSSGRAVEALVGTLDLHAVSALSGQPLIGGVRNAAYLGNVCVCSSVRRRGVGGRIIAAARALARSWGVEALYVHVLAANGTGRGLYEHAGFCVEREESPDQAARRGHCLDGVSGGGRTLLLRDTLL